MSPINRFPPLAVTANLPCDDAPAPLAAHNGTLVLPAGLDRLPDCGPGLRTLAVPDFKGSMLDLREGFPVLEVLRIEGSARCEVHLPAGVEVVLPEKTPADAKVQVFEHREGGLARVYAAQPYWVSGTRGKLNGKARFLRANGTPGTRKIVCRNLAVFAGALRRDHYRDAAPQPFARTLEAKLSDAQALTRNVPARSEDWWEQAFYAGASVHLVSPSQWGPFIANQFGRMAVADTRQWLVGSDRHCLMLNLRVKIGADGLTRFVAALYDPNSTKTHVRQIESDATKIAHWTLDALLPAQRLKRYWGTDGILLCTPLPETLNAAALAQATPESEAGPRTFETWLEPKDATGWQASLFFQACAVGHGALVRQCGAALLDAGLSADVIFERLRAADHSGLPGLWFALQAGHAEVVRAFGALVGRAGLRDEQVVALLLAPNERGTPGLSVALESGRSEAVRAFCEVVVGSGLSREHVFALLSAVNEHGQSSLRRAPTAAAKAYAAGVLAARRAKRITTTQWLRLRLPMLRGL